MKLLLDENLSHRLVPRLQPAYPGTSQVTLVGLGSADDLAVWRFARDNGFVLVTKDNDFLDLAAQHGPPPMVIRLALGNSSNAQVLSALLNGQPAILAAAAQPNTAVVELA